MRMLVAARPSYINPVLLAKMIATCDQLSGGRISVNLIAGQSETENIAEGVRWSKEQRYEIMDEEVSILKALWTSAGHRPTHAGKYYTLKQAELTPEALAEALSANSISAAAPARPGSFPPSTRTCICSGATRSRRSPTT